MKDVSPLLLFVAFALVGLAAWFLGRHAAQTRRIRMPRDYFVGLDHLINDRFDRATEVFARMAETDGDSAEIQFALGSLFRRRGEVDRAIRIHTRLREQHDHPVADQATFALALDYLSAGLMDRAEELFHEVAERGSYRAAALDQLLRVHEQQRDWASALRDFHELPAAVQLERRRIAAHYRCELAEQALAARDLARVRALVAEVDAGEQRFARARQLEGRLAELEGRTDAAIEYYLDAFADARELVLEVAPRALALASEAGRSALLDRIAGELAANGGGNATGLAWSLAASVPRRELEATPGLMSLLRERLAQQGGPVTATVEGVLAYVGFAHAAQEAAGRYQCGECGFRSVSWYWQCPGCRSWESQHPLAFPWAEAASRTDTADGGIRAGPGALEEEAAEG